MRYQSAAELRADLKRLQRSSESERTSLRDPQSPAHPRSKRGMLFAGLAVLVLLVAIGGIAWYEKHFPAHSATVVSQAVGGCPSVCKT